MAYKDSYGVKFSDDKIVLERCPKNLKGSYTIPENVTEIEDIAFYSCCGLTEIHVSPDNRAYASELGVVFNKDKTILVRCPRGKVGSYTIPDSVIKIEALAFDGCAGLASITIPNSVTEISTCAFDDCKRLIEIKVSSDNKVYASVQGVLFNKQKTKLISYPRGKVGSYSIPKSVMEFEDFAFDGCSRLTAIEVDAGNNTFISDQGVVFNKQKTIIVRCPTGKVGSYEIPNTVTEIGKFAFRDCSRLTSVHISNSITKIGECAFGGCARITTFTIPNSVKDIGRAVFAGCTSLTTLTIPDSITEIRGSTFSECKRLTDINIPNSITKIGDNAFFGCGKLTSITIPNSVTKIDRAVFNYCNSLSEIRIPKGTTFKFIECGLLEYLDLLVEKDN